MNIQICGFELKETVTSYGGNTIIYTNFSVPKAFDDFDINIITFQSSKIWYCKKSKFDQVNIIRDLLSIGKIVADTNKSPIVYCFPQNYNCIYEYSNVSQKYSKIVPLKDIINCIIKENLVAVDDDFKYLDVIFSRTSTKCNGNNLNADFYFNCYKDAITFSEKSKKKTTLKLSNKTYITALNIKTDDIENVFNFLKEIGLIGKDNAVPEWLKQYCFYNDKEQNQKIEENNKKIQILKTEIDQCQEQLNDNLYYKQILVEQSSALVERIFNILQIIVDCNLKEFEDKKREDFLIKKEQVTFIGEIKGVTSNIKSEHVSQLDVHCQSYLDDLAESRQTENVKGILIMNPFRTKPVEAREEVNNKQIALAKRNGSLIITTAQLLNIFERFIQNEFDSDAVIKAFQTQIGLIDIDKI